MCALIQNGKLREATAESATLYELSIPARQPYEGKATLRQRQKIWDLGYRDQSVIDALGKRQASTVIDQLLALRRKEGKKRGGKHAMIAAPIAFLVGGLALLAGGRSQQNGFLLFVGISGIIMGPVLFLAGLLSFIRSFFISAPKAKDERG